MELTPEDRAHLRSEYDRLQGASARRDPKVRGCVIAFTGMIVLTLTPAVGAWLDIPPGLALGILGVAVLFLLGGAVVGLVGGSRLEFQGARSRQDAADVLTRWAAGRATREEGVRAAARFLQAGGGRFHDLASSLPPEALALVDRVARDGVEGQAGSGGSAGRG